MTGTYVFYVYVFLPIAAIAYVFLAAYLTYRVLKSERTLAWRVSVALAVFLIFAAVLVGDEVVGRAWFVRLCEKEALTKVHRVVRLDQKYLRADGSPITEPSPARDGFRIASRYTTKFTEAQISGWPKITVLRTVIADEHDHSILAEAVEVMYWGGWLVDWLPGHQRAKTCARSEDRRISLEQSVFTK